MSTPQNPLDADFAIYHQAFHQIHDALMGEFKGAPPFNSKRLSPEEALYLYENPSQHPALAGQADPATGLPLTNAQASQQLLTRMGPQQYTKWVSESEKIRERRDGTNGN